eukprot:COSAG06_NODE_9203_length_1959_cov_6.024781_2_plen_179_part_00
MAGGPEQDGSGVLDRAELATLYRQARGEKLSGRQLKAAMAAMDADGSGDIEFKEFQAWCEQLAHTLAPDLAGCVHGCLLASGRSIPWLARWILFAWFSTNCAIRIGGVSASDSFSTHGWPFCVSGCACRWRSNGGDLEAKRDLAFTIFVGDVQLLLVAPTVTAKEHVSTHCCSLTHAR